MWTWRRAAPAYAPIPDLTWTPQRSAVKKRYNESLECDFLYVILGFRCIGVQIYVGMEKSGILDSFFI